MVLGRACSLALLVLAGALGCPPERLPDDQAVAEREACAELLACWYPGESGSQFTPDDPVWGGMANPDNVRNIHAAYGPDGTCWQVDHMAGTDLNSDPVDPGVLASSCGVACACSILELCAARDDPDPPPPCSDGDPCATDGLADIQVLCGAP